MDEMQTWTGIRTSWQSSLTAEIEIGDVVHLVFCVAGGAFQNDQADQNNRRETTHVGWNAKSDCIEMSGVPVVGQHRTALVESRVNISK